MNAPNLSSIGNVAGQLQTPVSALATLIAELGLKPSLRLNAVDYFNDSDVEKIAERARQKQK